MLPAPLPPPLIQGPLAEDEQFRPFIPLSKYYPFGHQPSRPLGQFVAGIRPARAVELHNLRVRSFFSLASSMLFSDKQVVQAKSCMQGTPRPRRQLVVADKLARTQGPRYRQGHLCSG